MGEALEHKLIKSVVIRVPVLVALLTFAVSAGVGYGVLISVVDQNTTDIAALQTVSSRITDIRLAQVVGTTERAGLKADIAAIVRLLE